MSILLILFTGPEFVLLFAKFAGCYLVHGVLEEQGGQDLVGKEDDGVQVAFPSFLLRVVDKVDQKFQNL